MFLADLFNENISVPMSSNQIGLPVPAYMTILFIIVIIGCFYLITIFQFKKKSTILSHSIWNKMHIISSLIFIFSIFILMVLVVGTPLDEWIQKWRWILYLIINYFLFLIYWFILSLVNKYGSKTITKPKKIYFSFLWTVLLLILVIFFLPAI